MTARTQVDRVARMVALAELKVARLDFPLLADRGASYAAPLQSALTQVAHLVALDRLQASLAAAGTTPAGVAVDNTPPRVLVSQVPSILVPIDGAPVLVAVNGAPGWQRVVNTRALILKSAAVPQYFLRVYDGWMMANTLDGRWEQPFLPPAGIDAAMKAASASGAVDLLDGGRRANPKPSLANGVPAILVTQVPAELIVFDGPPDFVPLAGTALKWASNTRSDVLQDSATGAYYVLLAGRWFRASALTGPWTFVASDALPADFARIPPMSLAGAVLPAVAGTPQAKVALIENTIPQTASVPLKGGPAFTATFDGPPQWAPIAGTTLSYARNAAVPVLRTAPDAYYAVQAGIWFRAAQPNGPWAVATSVPEAIYAIPPSSPLFYVTFVRVYGANADVAFMGYTPGYLGALAGTSRTVVYGTGFTYPAWIGNAWYPGPATYGVAATPVFNPRVGYAYAFAMGLVPAATPGAPAAGVTLHPAYWGRYPCCAVTSANVYRVWARPPGTGERKRASAPAAAPAATVAAGATTAAAPSSMASAPSAAPPPSAVPRRSHRRHQRPTTPASRAAATTCRWSPPRTIRPSGVRRSRQRPGAHALHLGQRVLREPARERRLGPRGRVQSHVRGGQRRGLPQQRRRLATASSGNGWQPAPAAPPEVDAEAQARARADAAAQAAGSYGMSNATRFTGQSGDGWSRRDAGSGGYSRTLGGDGGISAEYANYRDAVQNNAFDIAMNGGYWGDSVAVGNSGVSVGVGVGVYPGWGMPVAGVPTGNPGWGGRFGGGSM